MAIRAPIPPAVRSIKAAIANASSTAGIAGLRGSMMDRIDDILFLLKFDPVKKITGCYCDYFDLTYLAHRNKLVRCKLLDT
jgi:hypothetical protein